MDIWVYLIISIPLLVLVFFLILCLKALRFSEKADPTTSALLPAFNHEHAVQSLQDMVRFKTVSYEDKALEDVQAFRDFQAYLQNRYPAINQLAHFETIDETGFLFHLKGKHHDEPIVLMSHYDVVPENGTWKHGPFSGVIVDNFIHGRGTVDTKGTLAAVMESVEHVLQTGKPLKRDLFLAFSGDEETRGPSAPAIVATLKKRGVKPWMVLDEGGAIVDDVFPGVQRKTAVIGTGEKGYLNLKLTKRVAGSHAAMPPKEMAIPVLAKAVGKLDNDRLFKIKTPLASNQFFTTMAKHSHHFRIKFLVANQRILKPVFNRIINKKGGLIASLFKTTQSFTRMQGSDAMNVLPSAAHIFINYRIITGETAESVKATVAERIKHLGIETKILKSADPTPLSKTDGSYHALVETIQSTWDDILVSPYLMMAGTDARYHHDISNHVYRFSPLLMNKKTRESVHGIDEAIAVDNYLEAVGFYINLLNRIAID